MAVVIASALDKDMAGSPLFRGVSFKLERGDRMTLAGRNGAGKTTLLRMVAGETGIDGGELAFEKGTRVALHDQRPPRERDLTLRDYVLVGVQLPRLARGGAPPARGRDGRAAGRRHAARPLLARAGPARARRRLGLAQPRARARCTGSASPTEQLDRTLSTFSGGELTRASLARALAGDPDLLLLDEPTNHLDIASLEWLEDYLTGLDAAVILVAHDRWFLEAVGTSVLELEAGRARFFPGTWHAWRREAAARDIQLGKQIEKQQAEIARMERFIERFRYKATKARQAQSRVKKLDKMERIERDPARQPLARVQLRRRRAHRARRARARPAAGSTCPAAPSLEDGELWLERGEHVSLVGPNGAGKTTLIEALAGRRELDGGRLRTGHNVQIGYLSQHAEELGSSGTALEAAQRATKLTPNKARALLGRFLFSGDEAEKPLDGLSGGERRRLSLAILVASGANVLILDEPTNHLDIDAREALEDALSGFDGSVLLVSHDRALLDAVGTRTFAIEDGTIRSYLGGWAEYSRVREERKEAAASAKRAPKAKAARSNGGAKAKDARARPAGPSKNAIRRAADLEREVEKAEAALRAIEDELADPSAWASPTSSERATKRHEAAKKAVEEAYARWESASRAVSVSETLGAWPRTASTSSSRASTTSPPGSSCAPPGSTSRRSTSGARRRRRSSSPRTRPI